VTLIAGNCAEKSPAVGGGKVRATKLFVLLIVAIVDEEGKERRVLFCGQKQFRNPRVMVYLDRMLV